MLNLNAMFGSCESIFDQQPKYTEMHRSGIRI